MTLLNLVGSPLVRIVGGVLAVGLTLWLMIQYGQSIERSNQLQEDLQNNVETRERIDESIGSSPTDPRGAFEWLQQRNAQ